METPYDVLGIDPTASTREVQRAYRERIKRAHPDHGGSIDEFRRVRGAYEAIKHEEEDADDPDDRWAGAAGRPPPDRATTAVEYLDYEVLVDQGVTLEGNDVFDLVATATLGPEQRGRFIANGDDSLLEAAEKRGFTWPYACRGGACANCAVAVVEGDLEMPVNHILPPELVERGIRLSCVGCPVTDELRVIYNVKHLPDLEELHLPPQQFGRRP